MPPKQQLEVNPGGLNGCTRPLFPSMDDFEHLYKIPVLTLDSIMDHVFQNLPEGVAPQVYVFKIDIEGFEPRGLHGSDPSAIARVTGPHYCRNLCAPLCRLRRETIPTIDCFAGLPHGRFSSIGRAVS
jgi:hypothetical protein